MQGSKRQNQSVFVSFYVFVFSGVAIAAVSFVLYFFVKVDKDAPSMSEEQLSLNTDEPRKNAVLMSDLKRKLFGATLSLFAGSCYAFSSVFVTHLQQKVREKLVYDLSLSG